MSQMQAQNYLKQTKLTLKNIPKSLQKPLEQIQNSFTKRQQETVKSPKTCYEKVNTMLDCYFPKRTISPSRIKKQPPQEAPIIIPDPINMEATFTSIYTNKIKIGTYQIQPQRNTLQGMQNELPSNVVVNDIFISKILVIPHEQNFGDTSVLAFERCLDIQSMSKQQSCKHKVIPQKLLQSQQSALDVALSYFQQKQKQPDIEQEVIIDVFNYILQDDKKFDTIKMKYILFQGISAQQFIDAMQTQNQSIDLTLANQQVRQMIIDNQQMDQQQNTLQNELQQLINETTQKLQLNAEQSKFKMIKYKFVIYSSIVEKQAILQETIEQCNKYICQESNNYITQLKQIYQDQQQFEKYFNNFDQFTFFEELEVKFQNIINKSTNIKIQIHLLQEFDKFKNQINLNILDTEFLNLNMEHIKSQITNILQNCLQRNEEILLKQSEDEQLQQLIQEFNQKYKNLTINQNNIEQLIQQYEEIQTEIQQFEYKKQQFIEKQVSNVDKNEVIENEVQHDLQIQQNEQIIEEENKKSIVQIQDQQLEEKNNKSEHIQTNQLDMNENQEDSNKNNEIKVEQEVKLENEPDNVNQPEQIEVKLKDNQEHDDQEIEQNQQQDAQIQSQQDEQQRNSQQNSIQYEIENQISQ